MVHCLGNVGMTGVETFLLMLVAAQKRAGLEPSIACAPDGRDELLGAARALGVPVWTFPSRQRDGSGGLRRKLGSLAARVRQWSELAQLLRERGAQVLHLHPVGIAGLEAMLAARSAGARIVATHHATLTFFAPMRTRLSDLTFWLEKRHAHRVVLPYAAAAEEMRAAGVSSERLAIVPFCVDLRRFKGARTEAPREAGTFRLLCSARLVEGKGHAELLQALAHLRPRHPGLRLTLAGGGPLEATLRAQTRELGLDGVVDILGHRPAEKMPELLAGSDAVVLPSYMQGETFPISLLEAMAMALPAVGTRWFGIPDIIVDGETGFVVPPRDVDALAQALDRLASDPARARALGAAGQARARERFGADEVAAEYTRLYEA